MIMMVDISCYRRWMPVASTARRLRRDRDGGLRARDPPHLVLHGDDATGNDRRKRDHRADSERRDAGQALPDRTAERRHAAEAHQHAADDMIRYVLDRR